MLPIQVWYMISEQSWAIPFALGVLLIIIALLVWVVKTLK